MTNRGSRTRKKNNSYKSTNLVGNILDLPHE